MKQLTRAEWLLRKEEQLKAEQEARAERLRKEKRKDQIEVCTFVTIGSIIPIAILYGMAVGRQVLTLTPTAIQAVMVAPILYLFAIVGINVMISIVKRIAGIKRPESWEPKPRHWVNDSRLFLFGFKASIAIAAGIWIFLAVGAVWLILTGQMRIPWQWQFL